MDADVLDVVTPNAKMASLRFELSPSPTPSCRPSLRDVGTLTAKIASLRFELSDREREARRKARQQLLSHHPSLRFELSDSDDEEASEKDVRCQMNSVKCDVGVTVGAPSAEGPLELDAREERYDVMVTTIPGELVDVQPGAPYDARDPLVSSKARGGAAPGMRIARIEHEL